MVVHGTDDNVIHLDKGIRLAAKLTLLMNKWLDEAKLAVAASEQGDIGEEEAYLNRMHAKCLTDCVVELQEVLGL